MLLKDLESQLQQDSDAAQEETRALEETLSGEKQRREDAEQELARHKQVGGCVSHLLHLYSWHYERWGHVLTQSAIV